MNYKERFLEEYKDLYEIEYVKNNFTEADFKRYYSKVDKESYEWKEIFLVVPMKPIEKSRPRVSGNRLYDPDEKQKLYYARVIDFLLYEKIAELDIDKDHISENEPINLEIIYYKKFPKGESKINKLLAITNKMEATTNPDIDNYDKFTYDVLQLTSLFKEDSFIVKHTNEKRYSAIPRIEITIRFKVKK